MGVDLNVTLDSVALTGPWTPSRCPLSGRAESEWRRHSRSQYVADLSAGNLESAWKIRLSWVPMN